MSDFSIVVLISGSGSNLQAIIEQQQSGQIQGNISAVFSNKADAYGLQRAEAAGIKPHCLLPKDYDNREAYDAALADAIAAYQPDLVVLAGFMRILSPDFVSRFAEKLINIHPSLLPKYKGLNTHQRALDAGDNEHGCSVHIVTPELDDGPVIAQAHCPIEQDDDATSLQQKVHKLEHIIYPKVICYLANQQLQYQNGQLIFDGQAVEKGQPALIIDQADQ